MNPSSSPKKVVVVGAAGRMGRTIIRCLRAGVVSELELAGAVDLWDHPERGRDVGLLAGCGEAGIALTCDLKPLLATADVVVDFSAHKGTAGNAPRVAEAGKALVVGTTGLEPEEQRAIEEAARRIPIVRSPNMSVGMNLLFALVEKAAAALRGKGYDCEIIERHHRHKKDAPSGSALWLGEAAARGFEWDLKQAAQHGRYGNTGERPAQQIGFHAVRGGDIVGDHTVMFATDGEMLELSHRATSRDAFAVGALRAAAWVIGQKPGLYSMRDVLGL